MATLGNKLIVQQLPWHANMTELNHLGANLSAKPYAFEGVMKQLFSASNIYASNPLSSLLFDMGSEKTITQLDWEWQLRGADNKPLVVVENIEPAGKALGKGRTTFRIKLDQNWYVAGDVITPLNGPKKFQCRIMEEPQRHGTGWVYTVRLKDDDFNASLPGVFLEPGQEWGKLFSEYEEAAEQSGSTQYSMPLSLTDHMNKFRKKYKITDYAGQEVLAVKVPGPDGQLYDSWIKLAEATFWKQWAREKEIALIYNRSSNTVEGANGRPVRSFAGLQEKLEDSHIHYYSDLSAKLIEEYLMDIFYGRTGIGSSARKIKVFTGEYGMLIFNRAMQDLMDKRGWLIANSNFSPIQKAGSSITSNGYAAGYQFVKYIAHNGIEVELVHMPLYDDRSLNRQIDPVTGFPVESMRFTFIDFSGENGGTNLSIMKKANSFSSWYVAGGYGPFGPNKSGLAAHSGEYYEMHVSETFGLHLEDVTRCGELILRRNGMY